jgi:hypothetical protein
VPEYPVPNLILLGEPKAHKDLKEPIQHRLKNQKSLKWILEIFLCLIKRFLYDISKISELLRAESEQNNAEEGKRSRRVS